MKTKHFSSNESGQLDVNLAVAAILGLILCSSFLVIGIVVLQGVSDGADLTASTTATGRYAASGVSVHDQIITIGSETYTVTNTTTAAFDVPVGINMTAAKLIEELVVEIAASSTLVTAVDSGGNLTTITSKLSGSAGNYATTENTTNGAFATTTLTGGADADELYTTMSSVTTDIGSAMALAGTLILVVIGVAILMLLAGVMVIMRAFR